MIVDATHRFVLGDFIRIGGELGPWASIVGGLGIDPLAMGPVFLLVGVAQVIAAVLLVLHHPWGSVLVLGMAVGTLWYLVFGTVSSPVQIALISVARRGHLNRK